jgi:putative PEP-CTERM system histidine kinase
MGLIWSLIDGLVFVIALTCGVLFLVKVGLKKISLYLFLAMLTLGVAYFALALIMSSSPNQSAIQNFLFDAGFKILPVVGCAIPYFFLQVSRYYGRTERSPDHTGLIMLYRIAGFVTLLSIAVIVTGLVSTTAIIEQRYVLVMKGFLPKSIGLMLGALIIFALLNSERGWRAASGVLKKQIFLLMIFQLLGLAAIVRIYFLGSMTVVFLSYMAPLLLICLGWFYLLLLRKDAYSSHIVVDRQAFYSSAVILFLGLFLLFTGLVGKIIELMGGDIRAFLSVLGAFLVVGVFVLVLLSDSLRHRFGDIVQSRVYAGRFDYKAEWRALSEAFAASANIDDLFSTIIRRAERLLDPAEIAIYEAATDNMRKIYPPDQGQDEIALDDPGATWLFLKAEAARISRMDYSGSSKFENLKDGFEVAVPFVAEQKLIGILLLGPKRQKREYDLEDLALLSAIGHQAGIAVLHLRVRDKLLETEKLASFHKTASFVVHDLKNAVSMLSLMLQNAPRKISDPQFQTESLGTIAQALARMQRIIEKLKSPPRREQLQIELIDPGPVVRRVVEKCGLENRQNLHLAINLDDKLRVKTDPIILETIIENLLINAAEAIEGEGSVDIGEISVNGVTGISIVDTGSGMSREFLMTRLFHPFQSTKPKGLGIGLYQCREMFRGIGGDIIAESVRGKGSKFTLVFPE